MTTLTSRPGFAYKRVLAWLTLDRVLVAMVFGGIFAFSACAEFQSDSWMHLRVGQLTWQSRRVWTTDPLSSTVQGAYWPAHEWLAQVIFYGAYQVGGLRGVALLCAAVVTLTWVLIYSLCEGHAFYRALLTLLAVTSHAIVWSIRPHLFTLMLLALLLMLMQRRPLHGVIPLLFLIWANLHGGVGMGGLALIAATLAAGVCDRGHLGRWVMITGASAAATLVNPLGAGLWSFSLSKLDHYQMTLVQEWLPPALNWPASYPFFGLGAAWLMMVGLKAKTLWQAARRPEGFWPVTLLILSAVFFLLGLRAIRHTTLFTIAAVPFMARFGLASLPAPAIAADWRRGIVNGIVGGAAAVGCLARIVNVWSTPTHWQPLSPGSIAAVRRCPGVLYNTFDLGGPLLWFVPERLVFVDSRNDPYPPDLILQAVLAEQEGQYQELFARYHVNCALVPVGQPIYTALSSDPGWTELYHDARLAVFQARE